MLGFMGGRLKMEGTYGRNVNLSELRELVMDREASRAVVHGVSKSWTQLSK